jgi:glycyl-tRNA synthetase
MVFIVKKKINGKEYYYLNENKRVDGKVKTKTLAYLGKTKEDAEKKMKKFLQELEKPEKREVKKPKLEKKQVSIEELTNFCKRKGFVYPSSEIYGGLSGFYDYGSKGVLLKKNLEKEWLNYFLNLNDNFFQIETSEIMPEKVFVASGHLKNFTDVAAKCKKGHIERADHLLEKNLKGRFEGLKDKEIFDLINKNKIVCSTCKSSIEYVGPINMMFPIELGVGNTTKAFFRPETAQSPYVNFKLEYDINRNKLPFGLALVGRAYRNELSPRNLLIRQRAFNQAELQIFFNPSRINEHLDFDKVKNYKLQVVVSDQRDKKEQIISCLDLSKRIPKFYVYHMAKVQQFYLDFLKVPKNLFRFYELNDKEKAFYNKYHFDMEINFPDLDWVEIGGVHYRTDHDLKGHQEISKQNLLVFDEESKEKFIPHVLELSFGLDRLFQAIITLAYYQDKEKGNVVLKLNPKLSPIKAAVFPIVKKPEFEKFARKIFDDLKKDWNVIYDKSGSIGRRYARNDEVGTPFCITVDEESLKKKDVTIRDRDTAKQIRVKISNLKNILRDLIEGKIKFDNVGKLI